MVSRYSPGDSFRVYVFTQPPKHVRHLQHVLAIASSFDVRPCKRLENLVTNRVGCTSPFDD